MTTYLLLVEQHRTHIVFHSLLLYRHGDLRHLHAFPTRRSSDLELAVLPELSLELLSSFASLSSSSSSSVSSVVSAATCVASCSSISISASSSNAASSLLLFSSCAISSLTCSSFS